MVLEHKSYRAYLKALLADRIGKNPQYSLRAMARALGIPASHLSDIFKEKRNLSFDRAVQVAEKLGLLTRERDYLCALVQFENAKSPAARDELEKRLREFQGPHSQVTDLSLEAYRFLAKWQHAALYALMDTTLSITDANVAQILGISIHEARDALTRLENLELVEKLEGGGYQKIKNQVLVSSVAPHEALRRFHQSMLEQASKALETQTNDEKFVGSETFAFNPEDLPEARAAIEACMDKLVSISVRAKNKKAVYHAGVQLFRVGQTEKQTEKKRSKSK